MRVIIYTLKDGSTEVFTINNSKEEYHERQHAEIEVHDPSSHVKSYEFKDISDTNNQ